MSNTFCRLCLLVIIRWTAFVYSVFLKMIRFFHIYKSQKAAKGIKYFNEKLAGFCRKFNIPVAISYPVHVVFQTNLSCNLTCPMCFRQKLTDSQLRTMNQCHMRPDVFIKLADMLFPTAKIFSLTIGGEPLMYPYLDLVIEKCDEYKTKLALYTNVTKLANYDLMDKLMPHIGVLRASIDGSNKKTFEHIRKGASFEKCISALKRFNKLRQDLISVPEFELWFTIQNLNVGELPEMIDLAYSIGADKLGGDFAYIFDANGSVEDINPTLYRDIYKEVEKKAEALEIDISGLQKPVSKQENLFDKTSRNNKCPFLWSYIIVEENGSAVACCVYEPPHYSGNILTDGFTNVWNSKQAIALRQGYATKAGHKTCQTCNYIHQ